MEYRDEVHGLVCITEPVIIDLLGTSALQRLHGVLQHGVSALIGITSPVTRYDHSLGVMLLVRRLGAPLQEQIAALLHDVSHTAFSHVIDYVFDGHDSQSYHDEHKETYLAGTDVPETLAGHGFNWREFLHEEAFPLLEQPSPRLCADRLDYFLRDAPGLGLATAVDVAEVLAHLVVGNGRVVTNDLESARWLGYTFIKADDASWANFREVGLYELTAQAIRRGLDLGVIGMADVWGVDWPLWQKLHASKDTGLQELLSLITPATQFVWDEVNPTFRVSTKLRAIDPDVLLPGGEIRPLSQLDPAFSRYRQDYLQSKHGKWPMRVVR